MSWRYGLMPYGFQDSWNIKMKDQPSQNQAEQSLYMGC